MMHQPSAGKYFEQNAYHSLIQVRVHLSTDTNRPAKRPFFSIFRLFIDVRQRAERPVAIKCLGQMASSSSFYFERKQRRYWWPLRASGHRRPLQSPEKLADRAACSPSRRPLFALDATTSDRNPAISRWRVYQNPFVRVSVVDGRRNGRHFSPPVGFNFQLDSP